MSNLHVIRAYFIVLFALNLSVSTQASDLKRQCSSTDHEDAPPLKKFKVTIEDPKVITSLSELNAKNLKAVEGTTIVFFDLDKTLVKEEYMLFELSQQDQLLFIKEYLKSNYSSDFWYFIIDKQNQSDKFNHVLMEETTYEFYQELQKQNIILLGLTARPLFAAKLTNENLKSLNIDFSQSSALNNTTITFPPKVGLQDGIFYTGNLGKKIDYIDYIIKVLIRKIENLSGPFTVYHLDDNKDEINSFATKILNDVEFNIKIQPIEYNAYEILWENTDLDAINSEIELLYREYIQHSSSFIGNNNTLTKISLNCEENRNSFLL
jgi:hypothetical protein